MNSITEGDNEFPMLGDASGYIYKGFGEQKKSTEFGVKSGISAKQGFFGGLRIGEMLPPPQFPSVVTEDDSLLLITPLLFCPYWVGFAVSSILELERPVSFCTKAMKSLACVWITLGE